MACPSVSRDMFSIRISEEEARWAQRVIEQSHAWLSAGGDTADHSRVHVDDDIADIVAKITGTLSPRTVTNFSVSYCDGLLTVLGDNLFASSFPTHATREILSRCDAASTEISRYVIYDWVGTPTPSAPADIDNAALRRQLLAEVHEGDLDEWVSETDPTKASAVNDAGLEPQIAYLLSNGWTPDQIRAASKDKDDTPVE